MVILDNVGFDDGRCIGNFHQRVAVEIAVRDTTTLDVDREAQCRRKTIVDAAFMLCFDTIGIDHLTDIDRTNHFQDLEPAVIVNRDIDHLRDIAAKGEMAGYALPLSRRHFLAKSALLGSQFQHTGQPAGIECRTAMLLVGQFAVLPEYAQS